MSRIAKTLRSTRHPQFGIFMRLFSQHLVGEIGMTDEERKERKKTQTRRLAPQHVLLQKLDDYFKRWSTMKCNSKFVPEKWRGVPLFTETTWNAWLNLRDHIDKGCLNAGATDVDARSFNTTSPLEALHRLLKHFFH